MAQYKIHAKVLKGRNPKEEYEKLFGIDEDTPKSNKRIRHPAFPGITFSEDEWNQMNSAFTPEHKPVEEHLVLENLTKEQIKDVQEQFLQRKGTIRVKEVEE